MQTTQDKVEELLEHKKDILDRYTKTKWKYINYLLDIFGDTYTQEYAEELQTWNLSELIEESTAIKQALEEIGDKLNGKNAILYK